MKQSPIAPRTNTEWLADLHAGGDAREQALADLRLIIRAGLPYALANRLSPSNPQFNELVEDVVQETLLLVMDNLSSFERRSRFTTWAHKIAVRAALTELRRRRWKDTSLDALMDMQGDAMPMRAPDSPARTAEQNDMLQHIQHIIAEELTERQRMALMAVNVQEMPLEEVARRMGTNRNALYKLLHDARLRIKAALMREHLTTADVLSVFAEK